VNAPNFHNPQLGIVIPTFNRSAVLYELLSELTTQAAQLNPQPLIIIVNDGSTDETSSLPSKFDYPVHCVQGDGQWWFTRCADEGARYAIARGCSAIQIINDDSRISGDFLRHTLNHIATSGVNYVFAPISVTFEKPHRVMFSGVKLRHFGLKRMRNTPAMSSYTPSSLSIESDVLPGRGLTFSSAIFQEIKGFDCDFLQYHSDEDFCLRAKSKGAQPHVHTDIVLYAHHLMTSSGSTLKKSSFRQLMGDLFKRQSRVYLPDRMRIIAKHQPILIAPFLLVAQLILIIRSNLK
jgi:GT2 family glycosyltransferase